VTVARYFVGTVIEAPATFEQLARGVVDGDRYAVVADRIST